MKPPPTSIVIFGASGDLTRRKLLPALYNLFRKGRLPQNTRIVGVSRSAYSDDEFRQRMRSGVLEFSADSFESDLWESFAPSIHYRQGDLA